MYTARLDAVVCREGTQSLSLEAKRSRGRIAAVQCHVRWRVDSRRHLGRRKYGCPARPAHVRIVGKNPVYFDDYLADGRVLPPVSRPVKVAPVIEVWAVRAKSSAVSISNFPRTLGSRRRRYPTVRIAGAER